MRGKEFGKRIAGTDCSCWFFMVGTTPQKKKQGGGLGVCLTLDATPSHKPLLEEEKREMVEPKKGRGTWYHPLQEEGNPWRQDNGIRNQKFDFPAKSGRK